MTDREIQDSLALLSSIEERAPIDWKEQYLRLSNHAARCVKHLCRLEYIHAFREQEEPKSRIPYTTLEQEANRLFEERQAESGFYFPMSAQETFELLPKIMNPSFTIAEDLGFMINTGLTLKAAFYSLAQGDSVKPVVTIWLSIILTTLTDKVADLKYEFFRRDQQRERNQKNASTTDKVFNEIKLHPRYTEIQKILTGYQGTKEQNKKIELILKKIIKKISGKKKGPDAVTFRKYRKMIFDDFEIKYQSVR